MIIETSQAIEPQGPHRILVKHVDPTLQPDDPDFETPIEELVEREERGGPTSTAAERPNTRDFDPNDHDPPESRVER